MKMRTKHLLTAIMLPALFAACTNDDFQTIEQGAQGTEGRKMVDNVTLNVTTSADTRLAYVNGKYEFEEGDEIGACLMDVVDMSKYQNQATYPLWHQWFTLTDYIHTNYKFTRDGKGNWTTGAKMTEGNYFFVMPYNANYGYRSTYKFDASSQTLEGTDNASLLKAYADNNHFVGYGKVVAGDAESESVGVSMVPVFGSTGITIKVTGTQTYTVERIVLHGDKVNGVVELNPTSCTKATQYSPDITYITSPADEDFNVAQYVADPVENYLLGLGGYYDPTWTGYNRINAMKDVLEPDATADKRVEVVLTKGNSVSEGKPINVIAMAYPTRGIAEKSKTLLLDIYTDKGIIRDIDLTELHSANDGSGSTETTNVLTNKALTEIGTGNSIEVTFDDTALDKPGTMDIENDADLAALIHWNAINNTNAITANLKADVNITKAMYDELKGSKITSATINGKNNTESYSVTVNADVANGALDAFTFKDVKNVTVKGTQSIAKAPASPVTVATGATLNITGNLTGNNKMTVGITNTGTVNVNANVDASSSISAFTNYANMTVASGKTISADAKVQNGLTYYYEGSIVNAGTITVLDNQEGKVTNTGVIGEEKSVDEINRGKNTATIINNNGRVFLSVNTGDIYANGTSTTRLGSNKYGNLIITNLDKANGNFLTGKEKGNLVQEITADANTDAVDVRANTLWLNASLKVEKKDKDGNYEDVDLTGALMKNGAMKVVATGANARIDGNDQKFRMDAIEVNKDAKLVLNNVQMTITNKGNVTMHGEADHVATLTISSNAWLKVYKDADAKITVAETNKGYNKLDNNSSSTKIGFAQ